MAERTAEAADGFALRLGQLSQTYGMRLLTISDRIAERFVRPLTVDQVRALVRPAIEAARQGQGEANPQLSALDSPRSNSSRGPRPAPASICPSGSNRSRKNSTTSRYLAADRRSA